MARKEKLVTISAKGRDQDKQFLLTEMPALQAEDFANRLILALLNSNAKMPESMKDTGGAGLSFSMQGIFLLGLLALRGVQYPEVKPLLEEMMPCIRFQPAVPGAPPQKLRPGDDCQIEEVTTLWQLRRELVELHLGFSLADVLPTTAFESATAAALSTTSTSPEPSAQ